jgi:hypothetical protein
VLKYLLTAFAEGTESDSINAHELLGRGARALQELSFLPLNTDSLPALNDNPEVLKITFEDVSADLLSKVLQSDEQFYRFSLGFQVRPVLIATGELPSHSLLVGVNYITPPSTSGHIIGEEGIGIDVIPSMGPRINVIQPVKFELDTALIIRGENLNVSNLYISIGPANIPVNFQTPSELRCNIDEVNAGGHVISAGAHPISVVQIWSSGRKRSSNILVGYLIPILTSVTPEGLSFKSSADDPEITLVEGNIELSGYYLGTEVDDVLISFYKDGKIIKVFDNPFLLPGPFQTQMRLTFTTTDAIIAGTYRLMLHVNGQQAKNSPEITLMP